MEIQRGNALSLFRTLNNDIGKEHRRGHSMFIYSISSLQTLCWRALNENNNNNKIIIIIIIIIIYIIIINNST